MGSDHDPWKAGVGGGARCLVKVEKDGGWMAASAGRGSRETRRRRESARMYRRGEGGGERVNEE
jgi:hypothetical protein